MKIRDLTNFEELTVPEASKVIGGNKESSTLDTQGASTTQAIPSLPPSFLYFSRFSIKIKV